MTEDLFEDEKEDEDSIKKKSDDADAPLNKDQIKEEHETSDDESWIPLDEDEDLEMTPVEDEATESSSEDEDISYEDIGEAYAEMEEEEEEVPEETVEPAKSESSFQEDLQKKPEGNTESTSEHSIGETLKEPSENKEDISYKIKETSAEGPPWDDIVEIPAHDSGSTFNSQKKLMVIALILFVAFLFASLYMFLQYKKLTNSQATAPVEETVLADNKRKEKIIIQTPETATDANKTTIPEKTQTEPNNAPFIMGKPLRTITVGQSYSFMPIAKDADSEDTLTFFIANQPSWTTFDLATGSLTGIPRPEDVGTYENIAILASDGKATTSLNKFNINVIADVSKQPEHINDTKMAAKPPVPEITKEKTTRPALKIDTVQPETGDMPYTLPNIMDLIRQSEYQEAAFESLEYLKNHPEAYSMKLEVDCLEESVRIAFQKGNYDTRMFILPRNINGKNCYIVLWGLYPSNREAMEALPSVPAFFGTQSTKPTLVLIRQYL